jgi:hypothetical protein
VVPSPSGLPNRIVMLVPPLVAIGAFIVLVAFGISGTSTGVYWSTFGSGLDPALLAGEPRPIRSDEWLVQSSWIVSQAQQGFPLFNQTLPGGMDATIQNDLPVWDWSSLFRPHVWGFLMLPIDQGMAWRWWLPALAVFVFAYLYVVTVLPRNPGVALLLALSVLLSPLLQWWFLPTTLQPVAFAFASLMAVTWGLVSSSVWGRILTAVAAGYFAVAMAMSIYVPFIVPAALIVVCVALFEIVHRLVRGMSWRRLLIGLTPLASAAVAAGAVLGVWVVTRWETVAAVTGTVYPGERLEPPGAVDNLQELSSVLSAPFQRALLEANVPALSVNQSEASAPLLVAVFLLVPALVLALRGTGTAPSWLKRVDWRLLGPIVGVLITLAFTFIPGWDAIAHLMLLDRTISSRIRLLLVVAMVVVFVLMIRRIRASGKPAPWWSAGVAAAMTIGSSLITWYVLSPDRSLVAAGVSWMIVTALLVVCVVAVSRGRAILGAISLFVASAIIGWGVNPLYAGVYDLREVDAGEAIAAIAEQEPDARWVGVGGYIPTAVLVQSGVVAYNGVQTYPPEEMWKEIDPTGRFENEWNRLGNVNWTAGEGEPEVTNPVRDQVLVTFDSCSDFAAEHVDYVLSESPLDQACLIPVETFDEGASTLRIYAVR